MAGWNSNFKLVTAENLDSDYKAFENGKSDGERSKAAEKLTEDLSILRSRGDYDGVMQKLKVIDPQAEAALRNATIKDGEYIVFH